MSPQLSSYAFVGRLGTLPLAATSIATSLANVTGMSILVREGGDREREGVRGGRGRRKQEELGSDVCTFAAALCGETAALCTLTDRGAYW